MKRCTCCDSNCVTIWLSLVFILQCGRCLKICIISYKYRILFHEANPSGKNALQWQSTRSPTGNLISWGSNQNSIFDLKGLYSG